MGQALFNILGLLISLSVFMLALIAAVKKNGDGVAELIGIVIGHIIAIWAVLSSGIPETVNWALRLYDRFWPFVFLFVLIALWTYWHYHMQGVTISWNAYIEFKGSDDSKRAMEIIYKENMMMLFDHIWQLLFCLAFALSLPLVGVVSGRFSRARKCG